MGPEDAGLEHVVIGRAAAAGPSAPGGKAEQLVVDPTYVGRDPLDRRTGGPPARGACSIAGPSGRWRGSSAKGLAPACGIADLRY